MITAAITGLFSGVVLAGGPVGQIQAPGSKSVSATQPARMPMVSAQSTSPMGITEERSQKAAPNRIIVKFKDTSWAQGHGYGAGMASPAALTQRLQFPAAEQRVLGQIKARVASAFPGLGVVMLEIDARQPQSLSQAIDTLYRSKRIEYAHPDYRVSVQQTRPNDPYFSQLWGLENTGQWGGVVGAHIDAPNAWSQRSSSRNVVVIGVIDSGIDYNHDDLKVNMWKNPGEVAGNGLDDDGNGYVDDVYGIDAYNNDSDPMDDHGHGTHVAGTIGARGNNGNQVVGVNWSTQIIALKFLGESGSGWTSGAIELLNYAIDIKQRHGIKRFVLNNSWGGGDYSQALFDAIQASQDAGILFVAAAGNSGSDNTVVAAYPASYKLPSIISVGSSDRFETPSSFSNFGCGNVHLFAPGSDILSTLPGNQVGMYSGTSMASPHVAGAAALVWAQNPTWAWPRVKAALLNGADEKTAYKDISVTGGRLNLSQPMKKPEMGSLPSVWSVEPYNAKPGEEIVIQGTNFGSTAGSVSMGNTALTVTKWTTNRITATTPSDVVYGSLPVEVANSNGLKSPKTACFFVSNEAVPVDQTLIPRAWHAGAMVGKHYWMLGGETPWGKTGIVERYSLETGKKLIDGDWMMPTLVTNAATAVVGKKIYVIGGIEWQPQQKATSTVQVFDTTLGTWSMAAELPEARAQAAAIRMTDGRIYVFGGVDANGFISSKTFRYDPSSNTWEERSPMPEARAFATAVKAGTSNVAWVMGGWGLYGEKRVYRYNTVKDSWLTGVDTIHNHFGAAGVWHKDQANILFGWFSTKGEFASGSRWNSVYDGPGLYTVRGDVFNDAIFLFGGYDLMEGRYNDTIYRLSR